MDEFYKAHKSLLIGCLLAALFVYGYPLTNFALHIDEENGAVFGTVFNNISIGRWGTSLIHSTILRGPVLPFFMPAISLAFLVAAAIGTAKIIGNGGFSEKFLALLYIAFPQFAYQLEFLNQTESVALGLLAATVAFGCIVRTAGNANQGNFRYYIISVVLVVFAISTYQSLVLIVPALCALSALSLVLEDAPNRRIVREIGISLAVTIVSLIIYHFITKFLQFALHVPASDYLDAVVGWHHGSWSHAFQNGTGSLWKDVSGGDYFGESIYATVFIPGIMILVQYWKRKPSLSRKALAFGLVLFGIASPFAMVLLLGMQEPPRTFVASAVIFSGFWTLGFRSIGWRKSWAWVIVACCLLYGSFHVTRLFFADTMAYRSDLLLGNRIVSAIYDREPAFDETKTPVYFCGVYAVPNFWRKNHYDVFGGSFFSWDVDDSIRISSFLTVNGIANVKLATDADKDRVQSKLPFLPAWPNPNAISDIDGVLVVKLGPTCGNP
ncbi:glucosyltransferase domain-containing protein [Acidisoma cellulosilytica]|uniref:Glucosyltransferase domain-containing protein n=1 Tax=Acidisoma cellulosilyticum TaxID=2802395 RepID=A0A963Z3M1_9PROT|nr:glucosyltransferase domain-containing protein [Acidisoma cellulosilyticum]MCB8881916.1 glucosyltransferase domain-containing protein [Acidisoma cellulosilyticum]